MTENRHDQGRLKILVVDDNEAVNDILCQLCSFLGHETVSGRDGGEGLAIVREDRDIRMVFTDYKMPDMDGLELLGQIKGQDPDLPVVLITGSVEQEEEEMEEAGFDAVVRKPFELGTIAAVIDRFFPGSQGVPGD